MRKAPPIDPGTLPALRELKRQLSLLPYAAARTWHDSLVDAIDAVQYVIELRNSPDAGGLWSFRMRK